MRWSYLNLEDDSLARIAADAAGGSLSGTGARPLGMSNSARFDLAIEMTLLHPIMAMMRIGAVVDRRGR